MTGAFHGCCFFAQNQGEREGLNLFEAVKEGVTTRQVAEYYGLKIMRNGMAVCPFHQDKTPSMKMDKRIPFNPFL